MPRLSVTSVRGASATPALFRLDDTGLQRPIMCVPRGVRREKEGRGNWKKMRKGATARKGVRLDGRSVAGTRDGQVDRLAGACMSQLHVFFKFRGSPPPARVSRFSTIQSQRGGDHPSHPIFLPSPGLAVSGSLSCLFRNPIPVPDVPPLPPTPHQSGEREEERPERESVEASKPPPGTLEERGYWSCATVRGTGSRPSKRSPVRPEPEPLNTSSSSSFNPRRLIISSPS